MKSSHPINRVRHLRPYTWSLLAVLGLLMAIPMASAAAPASAAPSLVVPPWGAWAYTGYTVVNQSGGVGNFSYDFHGAFGESVVLTQTNTSSTTFALQGTQTLGTVYTILLCSPSCSSPNGEANITYFSSLQEQSFANLTSTATVSINGTATPALGLLNDHTQASGNVTRLLQYSIRGSGGGFRGGHGDINGFRYGSVQAEANEAVSFTPAVGVQPLNLTPGESWSSSSSYVGSLAEYAAYHVYGSPEGGIATGTYAPQSNFSGTINLTGGDLGRLQLRGGLLAHALGFQYQAPFQLWDGIFLLPQGANLFLGVGHPWEAGGDLGMTGSPGAIDYAPGAGHFGWVGSTSTYVPDQVSVPLGPSTSGGGPPGGGGFGLDSVPTGGNALNAVTLQTQPDSVSDAQSLAQGLVKAPVFATLQPLTPYGGFRFGGILILVVIVAVVVIVVVLVVRRRAGKISYSRRETAYDGYHRGRGADEVEEEEDEEKARPGPTLPSSSTAGTPSSPASPSEDGLKDLL